MSEQDVPQQEQPQQQQQSGQGGDQAPEESENPEVGYVVNYYGHIITIIGDYEPMPHYE